MLTELIIGRSLEVCSRLTTETLIGSLDSVPAEKLYSPALVIAALRNAPKCYGRPCSPDAGFSILIVQ